MKKNNLTIFVIFALIFTIVIVALLWLTNSRINPDSEIKITPTATETECVRAGCSNQLCVSKDQANIATSCEYKAEYACYQQAICTVLETGKCGFVQDEELLQCLEEASKPLSLPEIN